MKTKAKAELLGVNGELFPHVLEKYDFDREKCFTGSKHENLSEFAGRLCYRSGYKGKKNRGSEDYHKHIIDVKHHSIYGHNVKRFIIDEKLARDWAFHFASSPGWYLSAFNSHDFSLDFSGLNSEELNKFDGNFVKPDQEEKEEEEYTDEYLRHKRIESRLYDGKIRTFTKKTKEFFLTVNFRFLERESKMKPEDSDIFRALYYIHRNVKIHASKIFTKDMIAPEDHEAFGIRVSDKPFDKVIELDKIGNQTWLSFNIKTSRRVAQELTRHGFESAISMESTRYCDQAENELILHPYVTYGYKDWFKAQIEHYKNAKKMYTEILTQKYPEKDKLYLRKQASGACAALLPLGLETNLVFSCSLREFREISRQRINDAADKEITELVIQMSNSLNEYGINVDGYRSTKENKYLSREVLKGISSRAEESDATCSLIKKINVDKNDAFKVSEAFGSYENRNKRD